MLHSENGMKKTAVRILCTAAVFLLLFGVFSGVGTAATTNDEYLGEVFVWAVYGPNLGSDTSFLPIDGNQIWTDKFGNTVTFLPEETGKYYISGDDVATEGDYTREVVNHKYRITVKFPTAVISGAVYKEAGAQDDSLVGSLIGSIVENDKYIKVDAINGAKIAYTNPDGTITTVMPEAVCLYVDGTQNLKGVDLGMWTAQACFSKDAGSTIDGRTISKFSPSFILGNPYYFTIVSSDTSKRLETTVDEIIEGGYATLILTAPSGKQVVSVENGLIPAGQLHVTPVSGVNDKWIIDVPASGVVSFSVVATSTSNLKVKLLDKDDNILKSVTIKVRSGTITANAVDASVYIEHEFDIEGTNDLGGTLYFFIKGTNFPFQPLKFNSIGTYITASGKVWSVTVDTSDLHNDGKKLDAGTYTIYVASLTSEGVNNIAILDTGDMDDSTYTKTYTTVSVAFKQPFITISDMPDAIVLGDKLIVNGTAEGDPASVQFYIFGNNYFSNGFVAVTDGKFTVKISGEDTKEEKMPTGTYFLVIQHPMYDKVFNVGVVGKEIMYCKNGAYNSGSGTSVFNVEERQSENAANALCHALDSQDIDDMYVRASFTVESNPVPTPVIVDNICLKNGWNFVSVPKKLSAEYNTAAELFDGVNTSDNAILSYNAKTQEWEQVKADTEIVPLDAYWIYSVDEKVITPTFDTGAYVPASKAVYKGWNAVGISAEKPMTAADAFNNINWRTYLIWNPTTQKYGTTIIKGNKDTFSEDTFINLWKGGWLFMDEDNTIIGYA